MNRFAYCFKPISRERIGLCLSVIMFCLCLSFVEAWSFDPEFERIVPDVRGLTVDKARSLLNATGIRKLEILDESTSLKPKGTISGQQPNPGDALNITRPLKVWVSQPPETDIRVIGPLHSQDPRRGSVKADIFPRERVVTQGETAFFESRSTPREGIRETWNGPGNQQGAGATFEVRTDGLEPGSYGVDLMVRYGREQGARARATLTVTEAPGPPQQPGGGGGGGTGEQRHRYSATIAADTPQARRSQPVTFTAELIPGRRDARFRFHFGDGNYAEVRSASTTYAYETAGTFEAFVEVLDGRNEFIVESNRITFAINVTAPPGDGESAPPEPPPDHTWLWIGIALLLGISAGYVVFRPKPRLRAEPRGDAGSQDMEGDVSRLAGPEICLVPVSDMGGQVVTEDRKPFVREERWENE